MNPTPKNKPRRWMLFFSGLTGSGHIQTTGPHESEDDEYVEVIELKEYIDAKKQIRKLKSEIRLLKYEKEELETKLNYWENAER